MFKCGMSFVSTSSTEKRKNIFWAFKSRDPQRAFVLISEWLEKIMKCSSTWSASQQNRSRARWLWSGERGHWCWRPVNYLTKDESIVYYTILSSEKLWLHSGFLDWRANATLFPVFWSLICIQQDRKSEVERAWDTRESIETVPYARYWAGSRHYPGWIGCDLRKPSI